MTEIYIVIVLKNLMMKLLRYFVIVFLFNTTTTLADEFPPQYLSANISVAGKSDGLFRMYSVALAYNHCMFGSNAFRYLGGIRYNHSSGSETFDFGGTSIRADKILVSGINAFAGVEAVIYKKFSMGLNIDLIGHAIEYTRPVLTQNTNITDVKPELFNVLLINKNDRGSLNSEFYLSYRYKEEFIISAGMSHFATGIEYLVASSNYRTVSFSNMLLLKFQYMMWK